MCLLNFAQHHSILLEIWCFWNDVDSVRAFQVHSSVIGLYMCCKQFVMSLNAQVNIYIHRLDQHMQHQEWWFWKMAFTCFSCNISVVLFAFETDLKRALQRFNWEDVIISVEEHSELHAMTRTDTLNGSQTDDVVSSAVGWIIHWSSVEVVLQLK